MAFPVLLFRLFHPRVRLLAHYHHVEEKFLWHVITRLVIRKWDIITVSSLATRRKLAERYHIPLASMTCIYPGIAERYFINPPSAAIEQLKSQHGLFGKRVLLHVGRLIPRKNISFLIDQIALLPEDIVLAVVGEGPEQGALIRRAEDRGCRGRVAFIGTVSEQEKILWMHAADILVLASLKEGFGMVITEAAACGMPIIIAGSGESFEEMNELLKSMDYGLNLCFCPRTQLEWQEAINKLLDVDVSKRSTFIAQARGRIKEKLSWERSAEILHNRLGAPL